MITWFACSLPLHKGTLALQGPPRLNVETEARQRQDFLDTARQTINKPFSFGVDAKIMWPSRAEPKRLKLSKAEADSRRGETCLHMPMIVIHTSVFRFLVI